MIVHSIPAEMQSWSDSARSAGWRIAFVPTMGALHAGHERLVEVAREHGDLVVASIFVNPLQFDRRDDFDRYPRPLDDDLERCRGLGVDAVYAPTPAAMYPDGFDTHVEPGALAEPMEGAMRPGHFRGVTTVVAKLFAAVRPHVALFGQKDFQQLAIIRRMAADLNTGIKIVSVPTVREADGLALSSRNVRLSPEDRLAARAVPHALDAAAAAYADGEREAARLVAAAQAVLAAEQRARAEYVEVADAATLQPLPVVDRPAVLAVAVWFADVRLIDNLLLHADG
jgi:pantoate--beta-alanine ligase